MHAKLASFEPGKRPIPPQDKLDKSIQEAAKALIIGACRPHSAADDLGNPETRNAGHSDDPFLRFALLCAARAEFEDQSEIGSDRELQWVRIARDAMSAAKKSLPKGHYPLPRLLSESDADIEMQRQIYQDTFGRLLVANTAETPEVRSGLEFATRVAAGEIQLRYD